MEKEYVTRGMCRDEKTDRVTGERWWVTLTHRWTNSHHFLYRNSDKRKEQSRNAARNRRGKESEIFAELASVLPLTPQTLSQLDKASIMRLTIANLHFRSVCETGECCPGVGCCR